MRKMRIKLVFAGIGLALAVAYLAFAGMKEGWVYHVAVDQYLQTPDLQHQRVRLHGKVLPDGLNSEPAKLLAQFKMEGAQASLPVVYHGTVPDLFKAGVEVVVEGKSDSTGVFQADVLMTKCASKYQSDQHVRHDKEQQQL